ncbi:hypothetical protein AXG93_2061s1010 [Marchantia polymorpha subsp. ruderalis]|uniref:Uncharacterized protein n=1 Tax=Marchantia polymorpha subsp. ruderalis TaxID=1480154 RepID=A0A176VKJ2_MARPO|nr:hypothetical protein AXG93_2061s1010 [Marchantia polymorpha subsp. ruderalis]
MSTVNEPSEVSERTTWKNRRNIKKAKEESKKEKLAASARKVLGPIPFKTIRTAGQTARNAAHQEKLATIPTQSHLSPSAVSPWITAKSVIFITSTLRILVQDVDLEFHSEVEVIGSTRRVRTKIASFEERLAKALLPSSKPNTLKEEQASLDSIVKTQSAKDLNGAATSTSQTTAQPITRHSYPKFKDRDEDDDADAYIKLFKSISLTNKEFDDADMLQNFSNLLQKKARTEKNYTTTKREA